jgi:CheY-like chemotaxis protein
MPRVLVVDDTPSIRFLIRTNLELAGFEVEEAVDGVDCLDRLKRAETMPDVITVDVMMPRLDGVATVSAIRANPSTQHIAVVMVSTQGQPAEESRRFGLNRARSGRTVFVHGEEVVRRMNSSWTCEVAVR